MVEFHDERVLAVGVLGRLDWFGFLAERRRMWHNAGYVKFIHNVRSAR